MKVAAAAVACPDGNDVPEKPVRLSRSGRVRSTRCFTVSAAANWPAMTTTRKATTAHRRVRRSSTTATTSPSRITSS